MPLKDPEARRAYQRNYYAKRLKRDTEFKQKHYDLVRNNGIKHRNWIRNLRQGLCCEHCGEDHPSCLDFHHRDPSTKSFAIGDANRHGKQRILDEIAKCIVLCANCHRKLHAG